MTNRFLKQYLRGHDLSISFGTPGFGTLYGCPVTVFDDGRICIKPATTAFVVQSALALHSGEIDGRRKKSQPTGPRWSSMWAAACAARKGRELCRPGVRRHPPRPADRSTRAVPRLWISPMTIASPGYPAARRNSARGLPEADPENYEAAMADSMCSGHRRRRRRHAGGRWYGVLS